MTKDEADEKVRAAERDLLAKVRRWANGLGKVHSNPMNIVSASDLLSATRKLEEAEAARAALDRPGLMPAHDRMVRMGPTWNSGRDGLQRHVSWSSPDPIVAGIEADRADILAQAEKLPRYLYHHVRRDFTQTPDGAWINLNDLHELIKGA